MPRKQKFDFDLIVIGSGAAGSTAALASAKAGKRVCLVDGGTFGGETANWGDIPTAAMLHATNLYHDASQGARFGLRTSSMSYNYPTMLKWRNKAIARSGSADNRKFYEKAGMTTHTGMAHFLTPHEISVNRTHLTAEQFIIATGTHFASPDVYGIETIKYLTPKTVFSTTRIPRSAFIVGSSSEAIEIASILSVLGTKVYLSEKAEYLMPHEDREIGELMEQQLHDRQGITALTQTQVSEVGPKGLGVRVVYTRGTASHTVQVDEIIFTENRVPSIDLGLENASVDYTQAGIRTDEHLRTSARHIYAAGSCVDSRASTQIAMLHGRVAAYNLANKTPLKPDIALIPRLTFTDPAIAVVGLNEVDCLKRDLSVKTSLVSLAHVARSNTSDTTAGFVKLIVDRKGILLGASIVAPSAPEMIHELSLAIHHGMTARDLATLPHGFLSWSEAIRVAASRLS